MALVALPPYHYDGSGYPAIEAYEKALRLLASECRALREAGLRAACFMGLHPAEIDRMESAGLKPEEIIGVIDKVAKLLEKALHDGVIDGVGEVGRQHYRTLPHRFALAEYAMLRLLEVARDADCPVHLHLEDAGPATVYTTATIIARVGVRPHRILFHHASARTAKTAIELGYAATVVGRADAIKAALRAAGPTFMVESDFLDDPKRPCTAQCPWELGKEVERALGTEALEAAARILVDNVARFYGVEPP